LVDIQEINFQLKTDTTINSQFLTSYKLDSLNIIAGQTINELKYKPQFNLFANAGLNAVYEPTLNRVGFSTGVSLSWNIFDGNQRKIQREISTINLETLEFEKKNFVTQNIIYKNKILDQVHSLDQRQKLSEQQLIQYNKLLDVYNKEFSQAEVSVMDFKNLLKDIAAKKQENVLTKMERLILINSYNYWNY
jgi:outer membrane protein TolC